MTTSTRCGACRDLSNVHTFAGDCDHRQPTERLDPVAVFGKLLRELGAAEVLVSLSTSDSERRRAALDGLQLARDVLADAAEALA